MGKSKCGIRYSIEYKKEVCDFYQTHSLADTQQVYPIPANTIVRWCSQLGYPKKPRGRIGYGDAFKHQVCQYYDHHTGIETQVKFGVTQMSIAKWRRELGYRNKFYGYNLHTEGLQPVVQKRERHNFVMTKAENGELKAELHKRDERIADLEVRLTELEDAARLVTQLKQLFN